MDKKIETPAINFIIEHYENVVHGAPENVKNARKELEKLKLEISNARKQVAWSEDARLQETPPGMLYDRELARNIANKLRYFWMPCPLCGTYMAGFEWRGPHNDSPGIPVGDAMRHGICNRPSCLAEAERQQLSFEKSRASGLPEADALAECRKDCPVDVAAILAALTDSTPEER